MRENGANSDQSKDHIGSAKSRGLMPKGLATTVATVVSGLADHLADTAAAHDASAISVTPTGGIAGTNVQTALAELDSEKATTGHTHDTIGYLPYAYTLGLAGDAATTTARTLAAGDTNLCAFVLAAPMLVESLSVYNTDTGTARSWEWQLYVEPAGGGATLDAVAGLSGSESFTPGGTASVRTVAAATPTLIEPGVYWLAIRNAHATNSFGLGRAAVGTLAGNTARTKSIGATLGLTLDGSTGWTPAAGLTGARLNGRVLAEGAAF